MKKQYKLGLSGSWFVSMLVVVMTSLSMNVQAADGSDLRDYEVYDTRCFIAPMIGGVFSGESDMDTGLGAELRFGCPMGPESDSWLTRKLAWEIGIGYHDLDTESDSPLFPGVTVDSEYRRAFGEAGLLLFFDEAFAQSSGDTHLYGRLGLHYAEIDWLGRDTDAFGGSVGLGVTHKIGKSVSLRAELRYLVDDYNGTGQIPDDTFYVVPLMVGLHIPIGPEPKQPIYDDDGDGVPNRLDQCPNTPPGVKVDVNGCPLDSDGDGVPDSFDKCPNTPAGVIVNADGCPLDSDGDGVPDGRDKCPDTPEGVVVNADGCPLDTDGDGVPDGLDQCPGTLPGLAVNAKGCVIPQVFELRGVHFLFNESYLLLDSKVILDRVAESLMNEPDVNIMIAGHTDWIGSDAYNMKLSQARAQSVVDYLVEKGIPVARLTAKGFGEAQPVATNETDEGRERNRRVELRILDTEIDGRPIEVIQQ